MASPIAAAPASPRLCKVCRDIFQDVLQVATPLPKYDRLYGSRVPIEEDARTTPWLHHESLTSLQESAQKLCYFCTEVLIKLEDQNGLDSRTADGCTSFFLWPTKIMTSQRDPEKPISDFIRISFALGADASLEDILVDRVLFRASELEIYMGDEIFEISTSSTPSWKVAATWLKTCQEEHHMCRKGVGVNLERCLPSRLVDVSHDLKGRVRIRDTGSFKIDTQYVTLSHSWGSAKFLTLTAETEKELRMGIPIAKLSRTFQEAISVTRKLGMSYIWIDSLCILQDSKKDWYKESAMMGEVYRNSACNIGATASIGGDGGLFRERNPIELLPYTIEAHWSSDISIKDKDSGRLEEMNGTYLLYDKDFWSKELSTAPLLTRGWVVQERALCPRMLHFGTRQLLWECLELDASEVYPNGRPDKDIVDITLSESNSLLPLKPLINSHRHIESESEALPHANFMVWKKIIELSCKSNLTKSSDKLVSLSGIAKSMLLPPGDEYFAGMWKSAICAFLFWRVPDGRQASGEPSQRITPYVAPTWSWANLDAVIDYSFYSLYSIFIKVLETRVELVTDDFAGQISSAYMRISGPVMPLQILDPVRVSSDKDGITHEIMKDLGSGYMWGYWDKEEGQNVLINNVPLRASLKPDIPFDHQCKDLFFLATEFGWSFRMEGMILTYSDKGDGSFVRIGYLAINAVDSKSYWGIEYEDAWPKLEPYVKDILIH